MQTRLPRHEHALLRGFLPDQFTKPTPHLGEAPNNGAVGLLSHSAFPRPLNVKVGLLSGEPGLARPMPRRSRTEPASVGKRRLATLAPLRYSTQPPFNWTPRKKRYTLLARLPTCR